MTGQWPFPTRLSVDSEAASKILYNQSKSSVFEDPVD
uniref:Uncharacterized protein n=1 Tax=Echinococcus granulosus TaxID=6210 RepID=A0A068WWM9_ECHGR|nr:hypothetical protein EgrG_000056600 [Echinococcus granulosus]